jgi:large subunit ribosomal protein L25
MHPFKNEILHVDFQRVDENRRMHMKVPLHFIGEDQSPAVKVSGAIVSHITTQVAIECLPKDLPEFIEVDLSELTTAHAFHVSAMKLPEGVKVVSRGKLDPVVAAAVVPRAATETETEAAAGADGAAAATPAAEAAPAAAEKKEPAKDEKKKAGGDDKKKK